MDYTFESGKYKCGCGQEFSSYNSWYSHNSRKHSELIKLGATKRDFELAKTPVSLEERKIEPSNDVRKRAAGAILTISFFLSVIGLMYLIKTNTFRLGDRFNTFLDKYIPSGDVQNE